MAATFRRRARDEAARYGSDPWVFIRELLQNACDAGARHVSFVVEQEPGVERISCRDDGDGMSFAESRQFLFTLYASSKRETSTQAGRFGVGFWAVLRFEPTSITIRSRPAGGSGWQIRLDGNLETVEHARVDCAPGTEIILERSRQTADPAEQVFNAAWADGRFLRCRDERSRPLEITVNGQRVDTTFRLPPPSLTFTRPGLRGAIGLGRQPRVELFVHGLRVREAASLDDLLTEDHSSHDGSGLTELPDGLVPQVLLDSDRLEVLLARSDAREDRRLRQYISVAQRELVRLVRRQLDRCAPVSPWQRASESLRSLGSHHGIRRTALVLAGGILLAYSALWLARILPGSSGSGTVVSRLQSWLDPGPRQALPARPPRPYSDLAQRYHGPTVDALDQAAPGIDLRYSPPDRALLFAALVIVEMSEQGEPVLALDRSDLEPYPQWPCRSECIEIDLGTARGSRLLRLPVPTGYLVDPSTVRIDGQPIPLLVSPLGEPVVDLTGQEGRIHYRAGPGPGRGGRAGLDTGWPQLPPSLVSQARGWQQQSALQIMGHASNLVRTRVDYDRSPEVVRRHARASRSGIGLIERALDIAAGDCDVLNSVLVGVLRTAGVPARLAIGYAGNNGVVFPGVHAWAEALDDQGHWRIVDASAGFSTGGPDAPVPRPPAAELSVAAPASPPSTSAAVPESAGWRSRLLLIMIGLASVTLAVSAIALVLDRRTSRSLQLDQSTDLAALLGGALRQPEAFKQVQPLFSRRLVPLLGGTSVSLRKARRRAAQGRLFRSRGQTRLALKAAARGTVVVDAGQRAGEVVADLLGAYDLDHWDRLLARRVPAPFVKMVNRFLRRCGESWQIRVAGGASEALTTLDLNALGLGRRVASKLVVVGVDTALCTAASAVFETRPWQAVLMVLDAAIHHLDLPAERRARILSEVAGAAVAERTQP
jgi:signal transduction histidine kinase